MTVVEILGKLKKPAAVTSGVSVTALLFYMVARADTRMDNMERDTREWLVRIERKLDCALLGIGCDKVKRD